MKLTYLNAVTPLQPQDYRALAGQINAAAEGLAAPLVMLDRSAGVPLERFDRNLDLSGRTESRVRFQAILTAASEGEDRILLPKRAALSVSGEQSLMIPYGGIDIEAPHGSFTIFQDDIGSLTEASPDESHAPLFDISGTRYSRCRFKGFKLVGDHERFRRETWYHDQAHNQIYGVNPGDVVIEDMTFERGRGMIVNLRACQSLRARGNTLRKSRRDGFFIVNPVGPVLITENRFEWTGDDMVHVLHVEGSDMQAPSPPGVEDIWITNNSSIGGRGYLLTNVRRATFAGNHARFNSHRFLRIGPWNDVPASHDIHVYGNICEDLISGFENGVSRGEFIGLLSANANKGTRPAIPGRPDPATGAAERPEPYLYVQRERVIPGAGGTPTPHAMGIRIHHNTYRRTAKAGRFVDHGVGPYIRWDSDDYAKTFTDDDICPIAFTIQGSYNGLSITDNDCSTVYEAVRFNTNNAGALSFLNCEIARNLFTDVFNGGMVNAGVAIGQQDLTIRANTLDGDPYFRHSARVAGGKWANDWQFSALALGLMSGVTVEDNLFRNWTRAVENIGDLDSARYRGNRLCCDPSVMGGHPDNRGIRWVRPNCAGFEIVLENSDPTSAGYGQKLNLQAHEGWQMPTTGKWVEGAFFRNLTTGAAVTGWRRLTTGSGNVLGTDWSEVKAVPADVLAADVYVALNQDADSNWLDVGQSNGITIYDTSTLTAGRALVFRPGQRAGQRATYFCRTKGGFKRWVWDAGAGKIAADNLNTNTTLQMIWTGSAWLEVARGAG